MRRLLGIAWLAGCGGMGPVTVDLAGPIPSRLSEYNLLSFQEGVFDYNDRVVPYDLNTPLFSDYTVKPRALWLPEGTSASYDGLDAFDLPVGTVILKSFLLPEDLRAPEVDQRLIETRLLVRYERAWKALPYVWDADGVDATLEVGGEVRMVELVDLDGTAIEVPYLIPQRNQCFECHELKDDAGERYVTPIGPKARHLNRNHDYDGASLNQLSHLADLGLLDGLPALGEVPQAMDWAPIEANGLDGLDAAQIEAVARDYLDVNCAHCHNPRGVNGITSQLFLNRDNTDPFNLGVCKLPGSAGDSGGLTWDIVPGDPDASILVYRMVTEDLGSMMPLIGRALVHRRGVEAVRAWIANMEPNDCSG